MVYAVPRLLLRKMGLPEREQEEERLRVAVEEAREKYERARAFQGTIDLLVTDIEMPRLGGDELGELFMTERPGVRILQISATVAEHTIGRDEFLGQIFRHLNK